MILKTTVLFFTLAIAFLNADENKPPNIVFILTDDQDVELFGQYPMPKTKELLAEKGMTFTNMFVTSPLCCPSRSSILSGQYQHNHQATNNSISGNCSSTAWQDGAEKRAFPTYLKKQGYQTFFAGKYLNQYGLAATGGVQHVPPGWDDWHGLVGNSKYYDYVLSVNGKAEKHGKDYHKDYLTDVIKRRAINFLNRQTHQNPFFMMMSTPACHEPFTPAPQYKSNFTDVKAPRTKHFNIKGKNKHWLLEQVITPMGDDVTDIIDDYFRNRWRTLLSVDEMVESILNLLEHKGFMENTFVFFSSDNGYHLGQFSLPFDKRQMYDFDSRVPLIVRGPGIKPNSTSEETVLAIDLAPTFVDISGHRQPTKFDGLSFKPILTRQPHKARNASLVEYHGEHQPNIQGCPQYRNQGLYNCRTFFHCVCNDVWNNTFACIRANIDGFTYKYCQFQDNVNFVEVYNIDSDPYELDNIVDTASPDLLSKLSKALAELTQCEWETCHTTSLDGDLRQKHEPSFQPIAPKFVIS